jgi:hypothetical protein
MSYLSGSACTRATFYSGLPSTSTTQAMFGVPAANQRGTDYHSVSISAFAGSGTYRSVMQSFQAMADRSIALPSQMPSTQPTNVTFAAYKRMHYMATLPSDLQSSASFSYTATGGGLHSVVMVATAAYMGGSTFDVTTPDWTSTAGFDPTWVAASSATVNWSALGNGAPPASACVDGARSVFALRNGTL